jgi:serine/threonine-protein kinase
MIAERYRVIGLLGKGGMGEVYRADDLKLGQPVALKFLPEALEQDEGRLQRFLNEVRVARQVSHPNVCRVYDIGEHEGQHYLSMEFVDGEDLASLIRRIGRLSDDKALQIARQICAGLAGAHAKGIIHRDLKPANVMIDGRGHVRITDFGLAGLVAGFTGAEIRVGTPAYMSPEQLTGREVTPRSDIYSLGLVLYELFTGKAAFDAPTLAELTRRQQETMPSTPSTLVPGFDPAVERVILRCLEKDATLRPTSALAVAGSLPGGDPLAAALEAGETPSPEMVADAGDAGGLRPATALSLLALVVLGMIAIVVIGSRAVVTHYFDLAKPPAALEVQAREVIRGLGYDEPPADSTFSFGTDTEYFQHVQQEARGSDRWADLGTTRPSPLVFWYRESPRDLVPVRANGSASYGNPPMSVSGMARLLLDTEGRLVDFLAVPPQRLEIGAVAAEVDWSPLLDAAGLDAGLLEPSSPEWHPLVDCDRRTAWTGPYPDQPDVDVRVEAGSFDGRAVYFNVIAPWESPTRMVPNMPTRQAQVAQIILLTLISGLLVGAVLLARHNVKRGRGDTRGAFVMAGYLFVVLVVRWVLTAHHVTSIGELIMLVSALQTGLFVGAMGWVFYVAIEPYMRRVWPHALISWNRLLAGRIRDPLIGRDLLIGSLAGVAVSLAIVVFQLVPTWTGSATPPSPIVNGVGTLSGMSTVAGTMIAATTNGMLAPIGVFFLIFVLRLILRKTALAVGGAMLIMVLVQGLQSQGSLLGWIASAAIWAIIIFVIVRLGLLAAVITFVYANTLLTFPFTTDLSAWYAGRMWLGLAALAVVTGYGFYLSLAGRSVFAHALLQDA